MLRGVIFGLDGTLADTTHRVHLAQAGDWLAYRAGELDDTPIPDVADFLRDIQGSVRTLVVTSREEKSRQDTLEWLNRHHLYPDQLDMRPRGNRMRVPELKSFLLHERFGDWDRVKAFANFSVDACPKVCEAYRVAGFPCWQPRAGK